MKSVQSKNIAPANSDHSLFFKKDSDDNFGKTEKPFFNASPILAKLTVNQRRDPYEREADAMADKALQTPGNTPFNNPDAKQNSYFNATNSSIQRKCTHCEQEEKLQKKEDGGYDSLKNKIQKKPIFESNADPQDDKINVQPKCAECQKEDELSKKGAGIQLRGIDPTGDAPPPAPETTPNLTPTANPAATHFIVEDTATPGAGQLRKTDFLARLKIEVCNSVNQALSGTAFSSDNCPYLQASFERHRNSKPEQIEALINRYCPSSVLAQSAEQIIWHMKLRVYSAASQWVQNGADFSNALQLFSSASGLGAMTGIAGSGIGSLFFKALGGGAKVVQSPRAVMHSLGKGSPIESGTRSKMESAFGTSFSDVEIHTDRHAGQLSGDMNARAFTVGNHIAFAGGEHKPGSLMGDALMAHELAHTIQQHGGKTSGTQMKNSMDHSALEEDADIAAMGAMVSMREGKKGSLREMSKKATPKMKSGLGITSCKKNIPHTPCTSAEATSINSYRTRGSGWIDSALIKLRVTPVRADVTASLQRNFGATLGVVANLPGIIEKVVTAQAQMNSSAYYCAGTEDTTCATGACGYTYAGTDEFMICRNSTLASSDTDYQSYCPIHESYHAAFSSFDSDSYSGWNGHWNSSAGYPGSDPLHNADSYTSVIYDLR